MRAVCGGGTPRKFQPALFTYTMNILKITAVFALLAAAALAQNTVFPQGRLTLQSNTPVMTSDATGATTVYYTPYQGDLIPIYSGGGSGTWTEYQFSQLTLTISSTYQTAGNIYDVYVFISGSIPVIAFGPAWYSISSRGTNAGADIQQLNGIWVNTYGVQQGADFNNGSTLYSTGSVPLYWAATYVGSVYITANGETSVQFKPTAAAGGTGNVIGLWNAYNRVPISSLCSDSNTSWTYGTNSWEPLDYGEGSGSNLNDRVTYLDGLGQSFAKGRVTTIVYNSTQGDAGQIGMLQNQDAIGTTPNRIATQFSAAAGSATGASSLWAEENFPPVMGLNYIQAMQNSLAGTTTFGISGRGNSVLFDGEF